MEEAASRLNAHLNTSTAQQLELLLKKSERLATSQDRALREAASVADLRAEVTALRRRYTGLALALATQGMPQLSQGLVDRLSEDSLQALEAHDPQPGPEAVRRGARAARKLAQQVQQEETERAYRLAGASLFAVDEEHFGARIDTCWRGRYLDTYYLVFRPRPLALEHHSLPPFVPLKALLHQFPPDTALRSLLLEVGAHLDGFVARREEAHHLRRLEAQYIPAMDTSPAYDFVRFTVQYDDHRYEVKLVYDEMTSTLPSRCAVVHAGERRGEDSRLPELEAVFTSYSLRTAFRKCFVDADAIEETL